MKSTITSNTEECFICHTTQNIEEHHCLHGSYRKFAEKYHLTVPLCSEHHRGKYSPHMDHEVDEYFKKLAQETFEKEHSHEEWMKGVGRNYL